MEIWIKEEGVKESYASFSLQGIRSISSKYKDVSPQPSKTWAYSVDSFLHQSDETTLAKY